MPTSSIWDVPYQRNPFFTGREDVLNQLHHALRTENTVALSHPQGISGLGGIGKTQTALEYAYRYQNEYNAVFWVRADSITTLTSSLVKLADVLKLPERVEQDQERIVQAVLRWFRLHTDWLLIYDNIDDLSVAEQLLPKAGPGHILFTTRAHALGGIAQRLDIQKMEPEIGALLLLRRASLLAIQEALNRANPNDQSIARTISQELDGLPLALDQAGAYIKEAPCLLSNYLTHYQTRRNTILKKRGRFNQDYPASVATTWSLSFMRVMHANPAAAELLNFCAYLAPDAIPEELLTSGASHLGEVLAPVVINPIQFDQVCKEVLRFSLFQRGDDQHIFTVHRLVQAILRDNMSTERQQQWKQRTVLTVSTACPNVQDFNQWDACEVWVPHALVGASWIDEEHISTPEAAFLLNQAGYYLQKRARNSEAEPLLMRALAISEQELGATHPSTALSLNNLALLYRTQGKYTEAEPLLKRALAIYEQQFGAMHPDTAQILNNLALLYQYQGKYTEAEPLYQRALAIKEQRFGATHLDTAISLNNLAALYQYQGKYAEAEPLYHRALAIREQLLGAMHPYTAINLNNLAMLYQYQGKYAEAELLLKRALAIHEQQLGATHPDTAQSLNNLAALYQYQGKYAEAEPLYQHALAIKEQQFGAIHPDTAISLNNLAALYYMQEKYAEAEPLYQHALAIREQLLEVTHPDIAQSLNNLAMLYYTQGKYAEAEPLLKRALAIRELQVGATHPDTAQSLNNLAMLYQDQGKYTEAEPLYVRALAIREQQLGATHPEVAGSLNNLATLYREQGKYAEAEPLLKRALAICEQQLGATHPTTHIIYESYVALQQILGHDAT